jgi:hypothetical protein
MPKLRILVSLAMVMAAGSFAAAGTPGMFDAARYGAAGGGKALDSPAIDKAIGAAAAIPSRACSA